MFSPSTAERATILRQTLAHAVQAPFYTEHWPKSWRQIGSFADLPRLPLLTKHSAAAEQERLVVAGTSAAPLAFAAGVVSSASTREGRPLRMQRAATTPSHQPPPQRPNKAVTLELYSPRHGLRSGDRASRVLLPTTYHRNTVEVMHDLLTAEAPPIRFMVVPMSTLKWITAFLQQRGSSAADYRLRAIGTTGGTLTRQARTWLRAFWRVPLFDNYSLSELAGFALECSHCGYFHWHGEPVHFELIDPLSGTPTRRKLGELVMTTLWPSAARMPLIRYRSGDIVERGPVCKKTKTRGVLHRGRIHQSIIKEVKGKTQYLALSRDLLELAEQLPDIALHPHPAEQLALVAPCDIGLPKIKIGPEGEIHVELRYQPTRYPERAAQVQRHLSAALQSAPRPRIVLHGPNEVDVSEEARKL